jgi:signal transduction histidine kinase
MDIDLSIVVCISRERRKARVLFSASCQTIMTHASANDPDFHQHPPTFRLLIVDDDMDSGKLLQRILRSEYDVICTKSAEKAIELAGCESFDLVLLDIVMERMSGLDAVVAIRDLPGYTNVPIILISALAHNTDIVSGFDAGANDYITKPLDMDIVKARIKRHLATKRAMDEHQNTIDKLRHAQVMKDRFLRIATHDLKNPLNNIRLAHYVLRTSAIETLEAIDALDTIEEAINSMNELVEGLLDTSLLHDGKADVRLGPVRIETIIWDATSQYAASANRKNITLLLGNTEGVVLADAERLGQIVNNLLSNAIKFSPRDRMVSITTQDVGNRVRITVADDGPGIPKSERHLLFKAFSKLSTRPTGGESSSGLGLWIVKELAKLQNGIAGADFPPTGGSIFWVEMPVYQEEAVVAPSVI